MKRSNLLIGALLGAITSLPLMAVMFLIGQVTGLPFVPFDLFDWVSRALPGGLLAMLIDTMVAVIRFLRLGPTSDVAKLVEQLIAITMMIGVGLALGLLQAWLLLRSTWPAGRIGLVTGFALFLLVLIGEARHGLASSTGLGVALLALLIIGWGLLLAQGLGAVIERPPMEVAPPGLDRRRRALLLRIAGGSAAMALAAWGIGRALQQQRVASGADQPLPPALPGSGGASSPPTATGTAEPRAGAAPGTRPEVTPNESFYRIDIDLLPPSLSEAAWRLEVRGLFDRPRPLSLADLMAYPPVVQPVTLSCISNPIGGDLIGNAYWTGARLADVLQDLGLRPEAKQLYVLAADAFYESVTTDDMKDPRTLLVYGMDGKTLPIEHGFPLRILIPNRYGMKQPKWITGIEAIPYDGPGYWVDREWSQEARPQILSIIDTVAKDHLVDGRIPVGGIAWAGGRGISKVEMQVDGGQWEAATLLEPPLGQLTWVQWRYDWPRQAGWHVFRVRATDGTGALQIEQSSDTFPNGATGYHSRTELV